MGADEIVDGVLGGAAWGLGVALIAGTVLLAGKGARPLAKGAIKGSLLLAERVRELTAEAGEQLQDIYAEARAEVEEQVIVSPGSASARGQATASGSAR